MKEKFPFITALANAVIDINDTNWATWSAAHAADTYFTKINARLLTLMVYYIQATIDDVCQFMVAQGLVPEPQSVPSEFYWPYKENARFSDSRGVIQKRVPEHVLRPRSGATVGAPGSWRWGTWEVFVKCQNCIKLQPATGGSGNKLLGPMGRDDWFSEAVSSGLFWVNYFAQQTLDWMYGPGKPNKWPFDFQTPPWCVPSHFTWRLDAYDGFSDASLAIIYFPVPGGSYGKGLKGYILITPDEDADNPGNMGVGNLYSQQASMNEDYEVNGSYSDFTIDPLPAVWTPMDLTVTQYSDDPWLYQVLDFRQMSGSYLINLYISTDFNFDEPYDMYYDEFGGRWY